MNSQASQGRAYLMSYIQFPMITGDVKESNDSENKKRWKKLEI